LKRKLLNITCVLNFSTTLVWNISHSKKNSARYYQYVNRSSCTVSVILLRVSSNLNFLEIFWKILKDHITWISIQWELGSFMQMDWQTDMMWLIVTFQNFANVPKKDGLVQFICYGIVQTLTAIFIMSSFFVFVTIKS
jgi:hypothetical protein